MLARRLVASGAVRGSLAACSVPRRTVTYVPSKKPFVYYEEKDGEQVPIDLEASNAPHWNDNNEDFWRKVTDFVQDQPNDPVPYKKMLSYLGIIGVGVGFYYLFLEPGSAGREWCDGWANSDERLSFAMELGSHRTKEELALIEKRREVARTMPLLSRIAEYERNHPLDTRRKALRFYRNHTRTVMADMEDVMRKPMAEQRELRKGTSGHSLITELERTRLGAKPDEVPYTSDY